MLPAKITDQRRWLTPEPLNVAPVLVGQPLATPARRALAMGLDLALIALLSDVGGFWLVCGLLLVALLLRSRRFATRKRVLVGWVFAAVLGLLAVQEAWDDFSPAGAAQRAERKAASKAEAAAEAAAEAKSEAAADAAEAAADGVAAPASPQTSASASASAPAPAPAAASSSSASDVRRIARLEAEVAALRKPQPFQWRQQLDRIVESVGVSFGWGVVYFSLLPAWWSGQTLGKKLFKLRIVELTGRPLSVMRCLRRYGGYAAGMATGGLGFLQALWDPNRQGIQDRVAHTVVIDLRGAAQGQTPVVPDAG